MSTDINKKLCAAIIKDYRLNDDQTESAFLVLQSMFGSNVDSSVTESQLAYQEIEKYRKTSTEDRNYRAEYRAAMEKKYESLN